MNRNSEHIDQLISRVLTGEASANERKQLEMWMNESPENEKYFGDIRFVHDKTVASHRVVKVDTDKAWANVRSQMKKGKVINLKPAKVYLPFYKTSIFKIAASVAIIVGLSAIFYFNTISKNGFQQIASIATTDSVSKQMLSNSTKVVLNKNSSLTYSTKNNGKEQEIVLRGEAFFKINHSADTVLIVKAEETLIKDIGTEFNVKAYPENNTIEVFVESGEVLFYTKELQGVALRKGETGIYDKTNKTFRKEVTEKPVFVSSTTRQFHFQNTKLSEVINALNAAYPEKIVLYNSTIADCTITVNFEDESIASIMEIISETLGLQLIKTGNEYRLNGEQCLN